ncbi:calcium-binding protein [Nonomuraea sp. NPDC050783]|uniref:calcium-binding protein n=1 Tax=Nonomuraea sp. NPDC050783 TaxID=3154634 RepID=UPI00346640FC
MFGIEGKHRLARALGGGAALALASAALFTQPAAAKPCYGDCQPGLVRGSGDLRYDAPVGLDDQITVTAANGFYVLTDPAATITAGTGCALVTPHQARCPIGPSPRIRIRGLDGDDVITNATSFPAELNGDPGDDRLTGGTGGDELIGGAGADLVQGGAGDDTAGYSGPPVGTGVTADLDGATGDDGSAEDGPAGARDTIAGDVENLVGTRFDDVLTGNAGPNVIDGTGGHDRIKGLAGDDRLTARGGGTLDGGANADHCTSDIRLAPEPVDTFVGCETTEVINF